MGAPRARANPDVAGSRGTSKGAAALLDLAITQVLRENSAADALPAVLARLAGTFGLRAALAFQPSAVQPPAVLAAHPDGIDDEALLALIGPAQVIQGSLQLPVMIGGHAASALVAFSAPVAGQCLCALALIGDESGWDEEIEATAHAVATLVAAQIGHTSELARLADQAELLNSLIATAIPGVIITDENGLISHISESFGAMFGIEAPGQLPGTPAIAIMRRIERVFADPAEFVRRTTAMFRARRPSSGTQIMTADGRTIECDYWPILVDGRFRGDLCLLWDMTDRTEIVERAELAQERLAEQNVALRELDDARNQFVAMVSHELRTPLTSIVSFSELIRGEARGLTADGIHFLDIIDRNADRLLRLIGDLLLLSRLEAGGLPLDLAPAHIPDLAIEAVRVASAAAARQEITVEVRTGTGPAMLADSRRLRQVLDNLIGNAVKFSHRQGRVQVSADWDGQQWRIDVADSGIGIPPDEAARLFGRFVRASNARTAGLPGTGLGLAIVKVIVEMHGGHVEVATALDRGTTFSVYLPAAP
jgi:signal transduction histidine kinase